MNSIFNELCSDNEDLIDNAVFIKLIAIHRSIILNDQIVTFKLEEKI